MCGSPVQKLKVIPSHLHRLVLSSGLSSAFDGYFSTVKVACLSLAVCAACLVQPLSLRFVAPLFQSQQQHVEMSRFWAISNLHRLLVPVLA